MPSMDTVLPPRNEVRHDLDDLSRGGVNATKFKMGQLFKIV